MFLNEFRTISKTVLAKSGGAAAPLAPPCRRHCPKAIKYIFLKINYLVTIYVQFIWLANVVFLKKANNRTCPSYNIRKYERHVENVNTNFGCLRRTFS